MTNPETLFIQRIHRRLKLLRPPPIIRKLSDRFTRSWPDVLYIGPTGLCLWVEYKVHPNKVTKLQKETLKMLTSYQQKTAIITQQKTTTLIEESGQQQFTDTPWCWITSQLGYYDASTNPRRPT
jgi:hypothetical protein